MEAEEQVGCTLTAESTTVKSSRLY